MDDTVMLKDKDMSEILPKIVENVNGEDNENDEDDDDDEEAK